MRSSASVQAAAKTLRAKLSPAELTILTAGAVASFVWFQNIRALPGAGFLRGDAAEYWTIARTFGSFSEALHFAGGRTVGFPLFLFALTRGFVAWHGLYNLSRFLKFCACLMYGVHIACSVGLFLALRAAWRTQHARVLRVPLLAVLLSYPGLVAHTAVLLTDTFAADLLMLGAAALMLSPRSRSAHLAYGAASGVLFAAATLCRPTYLPALGFAWALASLTSLARVLRSVRVRSLPLPGVSMRVSRLLAALGTSGALLALATVPCAARYQRTCLADPTIESRLVPPSLRLGLDSPRAYWSRFGRGSELSASCGYCVALRDDTLTQTWAVACQIDETRFGYGIPTCITKRPDLAALYIVKKAIGLFDSYAYHDYAVDFTPAWARLWSRPFGALGFAGLVASLGLLILRGTSLPFEEVLLMTLAIGQAAVHSLGHIEPRYGYGALPFALYALALAQRELLTRPTWLRALCFSSLAGAAGLFLVQTHAWDTQDAVLHRIESNAAGRDAPHEALRYHADG